jgi:O-antigen/teichoic acid export membrane protein
VLTKVCTYGIPLSLTVGLAYVIGSSDRYLIAYFLGDAAAGVYSVAVDFTSQTLTLLLMTVSMAIVPLAMRSWENNDHEGARQQMRHNSALLLAIGIPAVIGLMVLAPGISSCFLGKTFRDDAARIMPIIALGTFLSGYKAYYLDTAFQFVHRTIYQVWIVLFAAIVNIVLNLIMIRPFGVIGAAGASVIAYLISMVLTAYYGRRHFALPFPKVDFLQVLTAGGAMAVLLYPLRDSRGSMALIAEILAGGALYGVVLLSLNFLGLRTLVVDRLFTKRSNAPQPVTVAAAR